MPNDSVQLNDRFTGGAKLFSRAAGIFVMLMGALVLTGWLFNISILKSGYDNIAMKANTAIALLLAGTSLWVLNTNSENSIGRRIGQVCAGIITLIGALTLSQHIFGWNLGIDQLLFTEPTGATATTSPGRMGPPASTCLTLSGIALLLLHSRRNVRFAQFAAIIVSLWALFAIIGYAYQVEQLYGIARFTGIALHTAVAFFLLGLGILAARPDQGITSVISSAHAGGAMARRLIVAAILVPILLGWIRLAVQKAGYVDLGFGTSLLVLSITIIFIAIIWQSAAKLNHAEQQRLTAEAAVAESERKFSLIYHKAAFAIAITRLSDSIIVDVNEAFEALFGYSRQAMLGKTGLELGMVVRMEERAELYEQLQHHNSVLGREMPVRTKSGDIRIVSHNGSVITLNGEEYILATLYDITERKQAEYEREQLLVREQVLRTEAEKASRLKDEFLATISHELRTPLTAILGWASMLRSGELDEPTFTQGLDTIERNGMAQAQLIEDLLDVSRIISGKLHLDIRPVDLITVINAAMDAVRPAASAREINMQLTADPAASQIRGDAARLQQVIWNLLSNAVKFTPRRGEVLIRLDRVDSYSRISVSDTGDGIDPDFLPYIFERFRQADGTKTRKHGGLGLGLAIARHFVELHGGTIEAFSEGRGKGATFTVKIPLAAIRMPESLPPDNSGKTVPRKNRPSPVHANLHGLRILAVDDEPDTRDMLHVLLEQYGADVMTVASANDAFDALSRWKPDLLLCDIGMPHEDGYSLIARIRALESGQGGAIPAIALTGYVRVEERMRALMAGYQMFVPKPVEADELASIIASLVGRADSGVVANNSTT
jgi:PAS domain S-box-containing protein